jgi:hypothetical protein
MQGSLVIDATDARGDMRCRKAEEFFFSAEISLQNNKVHLLQLIEKSFC